MSYKMKGFSGFGNSPVKKKKESFKPHNMYDKQKAETYKEHLELKEKGYGHSPTKKRGLWDNIHAKRKRGEKMRSKGDEGAPTEKALKESQSPAKCWEGYKRVPGTKEFSKGSCKKI